MVIWGNVLILMRRHSRSGKKVDRKPTRGEQYFICIIVARVDCSLLVACRGDIETMKPMKL